MIALVRKEDFDSIAMMAIAMMPPPPTIMAIATALPRLLMAAAAPAITWLPLNVVIGQFCPASTSADPNCPLPPRS